MPESGCPSCECYEADVLWCPANPDNEEAKFQCVDCGTVYWDWLLE
jgi:hypothetical protein